MGWNPLLDNPALLKPYWQYTDQTQGRYFRVKHSNAPNGGLVMFAQAQINADSSIDLYGAQLFEQGSEYDNFQMIPPGHFTERRIAFKRIDAPATLEFELRRLLNQNLFKELPIVVFPEKSQWQIQIEVSDWTEPLTAVPLTSVPLLKDADFNSVVLLLHMDGVDGSTLFSDVSGKTIKPQGSVKILSPGGQFGGAASFNGNGDYLTIDNSADFDFGTADFTIECWIRPELEPSRSRGIICKVSPSLEASTLILTQDNKINFGAHGFAGITGDSIITLGNWHHIAVSRNQGTARLFIDGKLNGTLAFPESPSYGNPLYIGCLDPTNTDYSFWFKGLIDEVRISKGVGRYNDSFSVPNAPFPNS